MMTTGPATTTDVEPCPACHPEVKPAPLSPEPSAGADQSGSAPPRSKPCYIGAPAIFKLELACKELRAAFGGFGPYLVGSALERANWRDVDVRYMLRDDEFRALFPDAAMNSGGATWEFDARWLWLTTSISERLSHLTGLPIDFQFQPQTWANERHKKSRSPLGLKFAKD